ncbi:MAG: MurR/RpiR family transcriptional regulator [Oscillospiraceae bacterium]|jgi:DNA-binding MurR/RpiR family transcriptional regulator|nr:MurR/RpiR family transcriptional regulator [Oscillospiraceae bacterium]
MNTDFMDTIDAAYAKFSKGQKAIANYIKNHYDKAAFMTASRLGATVGVSESTVVRFATEIGFEGYPQLQRALKEIVRNRLTSVQRMEVTNSRLWGSDVLDKVLRMDMDTIRRTMEETDKETFYEAVAEIMDAKKIYIMGIRSAAALASFMTYYFTHIFEDVRNVDTASTSVIFEQMLRIGAEDVFIGITFPRYSKRTLKAATFAKSSGARVIAITDSRSAPIAQIADYVLVAKSDIASFVDSLVAPLSLINALIVAIGLEKKEEIAETYARLESIWDEYNVYEKTNGEQDGHDSDI